MPSLKEIVVNTALSGEELKVVLRDYFERLLTAEGMLTPNAAFGRVSFTLALRLHIDNPWMRDYPATTFKSERASPAAIAEQPSLVALERTPLADPSPDAAKHTTTLHANVESPNAERVRLGIPVPVVVEQRDGTRSVERIKYPKPADDPATDPLHVMDEAEARAAGHNIIEVD
jgi:hypothetical protein